MTESFGDARIDWVVCIHKNKCACVFVSVCICTVFHIIKKEKQNLTNQQHGVETPFGNRQTSLGFHEKQQSSYLVME